MIRITCGLRIPDTYEEDLASAHPMALGGRLWMSQPTAAIDMIPFSSRAMSIKKKNPDKNPGVAELAIPNTPEHT